MTLNKYISVCDLTPLQVFVGDVKPCSQQEDARALYKMLCSPIFITKGPCNKVRLFCYQYFLPLSLAEWLFYFLVVVFVLLNCLICLYHGVCVIKLFDMFVSCVFSSIKISVPLFSSCFVLVLFI
eukprot:TRINITY_DN68279_c0_g1_i5.p2 TRINITY_DN68279_c0_g1~~TRINITY_DN68279_c0_g1_i5.p2  ORF type:complete len:125 (-),score=6.46 TRINITY_DN68279_c0_g1_i5:600-974(-)